MNRRSRIVVESRQQRYQRSARSSVRNAEWLSAISLIVAAMLATFLALFLTSRPYDPMNSSIAPQLDIPSGPIALQPSPKPSPSPTASKENQKASPQPGGGIIETPVDDATIQSSIEKAIG